MSMEGIFSSVSEKDIKREIVLELLDSKKNLDEKTELERPLQWACLNSMKGYIDDKALPKSAKILGDWVHQSHRFLISKSRKGRNEYIQALEALANMDDKKNDGNELSSMLGGQ